MSLDESFVEGLSECRSDFGFVPVDVGEVEVTVAGFEGVDDGGADFAGGATEGSIGDDGHFVAAGQFVGWGGGRKVEFGCWGGVSGGHCLDFIGQQLGVFMGYF